MIQNRPLPDFATFRRTWLRVCSWALAFIWLVVAVFWDGMLIVWLTSGPILLVIVYTVQAAALEGHGAPHLPISKWSALGLSLAMAFLDALLADAWFVVLKMLVTSVQYFAFNWVGEITGVGIVGFVCGFVINCMTGFYLPRYDYLRLLFVGHFVGLLLMMLPAFYVWLGGWEIRADMDNNLETLAAFGLAGCFALAVWGISPAGYLYAYRGYSRRLQLPASRLADEAEID